MLKWVKILILIYKYSCFDLWFDASGSFSLSDGNDFGENAVIFCADMSSSAHVDNRKTDILILSKDLTQGLENPALTAEKEYAIIRKKWATKKN